MLFAVKDLELRKIRFETSFAPGRIDFLDPALKQVAPLEASGVAELAGPLEDIRVHGRLAGSLEGKCDRCLEPVPLKVGGEFDLLYRPAEADSAQAEKAISEEDTEVGYYEGSGVQLEDVVREQVLLWLPLHVFCQPGCKGICPTCGVNRNREACACQAPRLDDRWAALKNFKTGD